jgi:hypothetical protein
MALGLGGLLDERGVLSCLCGAVRGVLGVVCGVSCGLMGGVPGVGGLPGCCNVGCSGVNTCGSGAGLALPDDGLTPVGEGALCRLVVGGLDRFVGSVSEW